MSTSHSDTLRCCRTCGEEKPITSFSIDKRWRSTYKLDCKSCTNIKKRNSYDPEKRRHDGIKKYGITVDDFVLLYEQQNGLCSICKTKISIDYGKTKKNKAHIDHCHSTGKVRGLLCTECNLGLGYFKDNILNLNEAISYLVRSHDD